MIILGIGMGPALPLYTLAVQNSVNPREIGAATSSSQFFRSIGSTIGVAVFGTILATVLSAQLPKYVPSGIQNAGMVGTSFSMGQLESGNMETVGDRIKARMDATYGRIEAVMTRSDPAALRSLLDDPLLPDTYKAALKVRAASAAEDPAATPGDARTKAMLAAVRTSLDETAAALTTQIGIALKKAFTEAVRRVYFWGLFVIAAGFLFTLFLPEISLRKTHGHVTAALGDGVAPVPGSAPLPGGTSEAAAAVSEN
jgi:hypothetical protein